MKRVLRSIYAAREQLVYSGLTVAVLIVGYLTAIEALGEPVRSRAVLLLLIAFAFLAGWLHEVHRPGGSLDLGDQLRANQQQDT